MLNLLQFSQAQLGSVEMGNTARRFPEFCGVLAGMANNPTEVRDLQDVGLKVTQFVAGTGKKSYSLRSQHLFHGFLTRFQ